MTMKTRGAVGPVKEAYEKKGHLHITTKPCEHVVLFKDKSSLRGGGTTIVTFHGDDDGRARVTSSEV